MSRPLATDAKAGMISATIHGRHNVTMNRYIHRIALAAIIAAFAPFFIGAAETAPATLDDRAALEAWTDGTINALLKAHHCAGGVVAIVRNGEILLAKGYGYSDVDNRKPVDPATTLFRIGSVSKLFVWTSVMQMIEQGRLDLNADVNTYLKDLQVPKRYGQPITMKDLMTHTPGFEDQVLGLFSHDPASMRPLGDILKKEMPARVREPGKIASYSNHGTGLAMHVVEEITGEPWEKYVQTQIVDPLGLKHTVLAQPLPDAFSADMSKGYRFGSEVFMEQEFELVPLGPVGGISTTALDMAAFMQMFLNFGEYNGARVLEEGTARTMQSPLHTMAPGNNPQAYGMMDTSVPGLHVVGHGGDTLWFHTLFALLPEHNTGVFASFNTNTGPLVRDGFMDAFAKRYFVPNEPAKPIAPDDFEDRAARYTGSYRANRFSHRSFAKMAVALQPITVSSDGKGALLSSMSGKTRWIEVAPNTFQEEDGRRRIVFIENAAGGITHFVPAELGIFAFERNGALDLPQMHLAAFVGTLLVCTLALLCWPLAIFLRWKHDVITSRDDLIPMTTRVIGWVTCAATLGFVVTLIASVGDPMDVVFGAPKSFPVLLSIPLVIAAFALLMAGLSARVWMRGQGSIPARLAYSLVTLMLLVFVVQTVYWNLTIIQNYSFL